MTKLLKIAALVCAVPITAMAAGDAVPPEDSEFFTVRALLDDRYTPFGVSQSGNASFGMTKEGGEIYLCFLGDTSEYASVRQKTLLSAIAGEEHSSTVPNIRMYCVQTQ